MTITTPNPILSVVEPGPAVAIDACLPIDAGQLDYAVSMSLQADLVSRRKLDEVPDCLMFVQYPPTITQGKSGTMNHLLASREDLLNRGVDFFYTNRGGDITYHGPGQLIVYPILNLKKIRTDIHWYLRQLEACIIATLNSFGIESGRVSGATGVWVGSWKIAAIGVRTSRWVTSHGLALNVDPELGFFDLIIPCGLANRQVTSMSRHLGSACPSLREVRLRFCECFAEVFARRVQTELLESRSMLYSFVHDSSQGARVNGSR